MSDTKANEVGSITWADLTVKNAEQVKQFYTEVVGWKSESVDMGGYTDFNMNTADESNTVAGICHSKGVNAELPPQWLIYITVENVESSANRCEELGGKILSGPKGMGGYGKFCVIQDPAGAVAALFEPEK